MKVLLGVTGSVSAVLTDKMVAELEKSGHEVKVVFNWSVIYFWSKGFWLYVISILYSKLWYPLLPRTLANEGLLKRKHFTDFHEWRGFWYQKNDPVLHIDLRNWADVLVIAPMTATTLGKVTSGICDNLLGCIFRAWRRDKPVILAPAMNTWMWVHPLTQSQISCLERWYDDVRVVQPVAKKLACGDEGVGALAPIGQIVQAVNAPRGGDDEQLPAAEL